MLHCLADAREELRVLAVTQLCKHHGGSHGEGKALALVRLRVFRSHLATLGAVQRHE